MTQAIGVRLPDEVLKKIEELGKSELEDRSTVIRKAVMQGLRDLLAKKAAEEYIKGKVTLSEAASRAEMPVRLARMAVSALCTRLVIGLLLRIYRTSICVNGNFYRIYRYYYEHSVLRVTLGAHIIIKNSYHIDSTC